MVFLDIRGALDGVDKNRLFECFTKFGIPEKFVTILKARCKGTYGQARVYGELSPWFTFSSGVRQGSRLSNFIMSCITS